MRTIAVVGGGIAGLAAAHRCAAAHDVVVFERETQPGGKIRSERIEGYLFEWGPSGFLAGAGEVRTLIADVGLADALSPASAAAKHRFIWWRGRLHRLPTKPPDALQMTILSPLGKLRALGDLLQRPATRADDESVFSFMRRHFGREVAERLVSPALLGISGGDAKATSAAALFPRLRAAETAVGSVIRGMMQGPRGGATLSSFADGGMQRLTDAIAQRLGDRVRCGVGVHRVGRDGDGWRIAHDGGETRADGLIVATPADAAARIVDGLDGELANELRRIPYAPMRAFGIAFRAADVPTPLDGFGFLAARDQGVRILGAFYTSCIVPEHAPPGTVYLRIFLGGATDPEIIALDRAAVEAIVRADLRTVLGITAEPIATHEAVWPQAIPQYGLPHRSVVRAIERREARHPAFGLAGNAYRGLGVGDNVRDALAVADRVSAVLAH